MLARCLFLTVIDVIIIAQLEVNLFLHRDHRFCQRFNLQAICLFNYLSFLLKLRDSLRVLLSIIANSILEPGCNYNTKACAISFSNNFRFHCSLTCSQWQGPFSFGQNRCSGRIRQQLISSSCQRNIHRIFETKCQFFSKVFTYATVLYCSQGIHPFRMATKRILVAVNTPQKRLTLADFKQLKKQIRSDSSFVIVIFRVFILKSISSSFFSQTLR